MRRSLRKLDRREVEAYAEAESLFTVESLEAARQRLKALGREPVEFCFFSWMQQGVRYFRVWEDKKWQQGIALPVPFGQVAARLKRAEAEKLFTTAKRYKGDRLRFEWDGAVLMVTEAETNTPLVGISAPRVGGDLLFVKQRWNPGRAAHFCNAILVRGLHPDQAYGEAEGLEAEVASW